MSIMESLQVLQKQQIDVNQVVTTADLMDLRWGSMVHAASFLRKAATADCRLTAGYIIQGFWTLHQVLEDTSITPASYNKLLDGILSSKHLNQCYKGFGARLFYLEDMHQCSYWLPVLHRIIAFNVGLILQTLQMAALGRARDRLNDPQPDDLIQLSSATTKAKNVPITVCTLPIIHKQEWMKIRLELAEKSHREYVISGGTLDYPVYIKRNFQVCIKRALAMLTICRCFGPIALFWDALSPSCLYKLRHSDFHAAALEEKYWSTLNRTLWEIPNLNPFDPFDETKSKIKDMFRSEGKLSSFSDIFDYLEDEKLYKVYRDKVLEMWTAKNTPL